MTEDIKDRWKRIKFNRAKINDLLEFPDDYDKISLHNKDTDYLLKKNQNELLCYIGEQDKQLSRLADTVRNIKDADTLNSINRANDILTHWEAFYTAIEETPGFKEEWEALLMAMKLTFN